MDSCQFLSVLETNEIVYGVLDPLVIMKRNHFRLLISQI